MIFTRETTPATIRRGIVVVSLSTPSMRKRTRMSFVSPGSKWMSDAPSSTACGDHRVDELDDRRVLGGLADLGDGCEARPRPRPRRSPRRPRRRGGSCGAIRASMSSGEATTGRSPGRSSASGRRARARSTGRPSRRAASCRSRRSRSAPRCSGAPPARGDQVHGGEIGLVDRQVDVVEAEALGDRSRELVGAERAGLEQHLLGRPAGGLRLLDRGVDALARAGSPSSTMTSEMKREPPPRLVGRDQACAGTGSRATASVDRAGGRDRPERGAGRRSSQLVPDPLEQVPRST